MTHPTRPPGALAPGGSSVFDLPGRCLVRFPTARFSFLTLWFRSLIPCGCCPEVTGLISPGSSGQESPRIALAPALGAFGNLRFNTESTGSRPRAIPSRSGRASGGGSASVLSGLSGWNRPILAANSGVFRRGPAGTRLPRTLARRRRPHFATCGRAGGPGPERNPEDRRQFGPFRAGRGGPWIAPVIRKVIPGFRRWAVRRGGTLT